MAQYAIQGYEVNALDYVLKPVSAFAFSQELDKAVRRLKTLLYGPSAFPDGYML